MKFKVIVISLLFTPVLAFILSPVKSFAQASLSAEAPLSGAKAGLTPESPFYFLDTIGETFQEFFTFNSESKARLQITFAAERVAEIKVMLETKGVEAKGLAIAKARLKKHLDSAAEIVAKQKDKGKDMSNLLKETDDIDKEVKKLKKEKEEQKELSKLEESHDKKIKQGVVPDKQMLKVEKDWVPQNKKIVEKVLQKDNSKQQFSILEEELMGAQAGGSYLSPGHSNRIQKDLTNLENQNYDAAEIKRLRAIVLKLSPHLQDQSNSSPGGNLNAEKKCQNFKPTLTADITDFSKIQKITAPGSPSSEGPKGHSFIWTNGLNVPVYAPVDAVLESGSYGKDNADSPAQYILWFDIKGFCNFQFKFDHIDEPIDAIKKNFSSNPKIADSRGTLASNRVEFKAGDLVGYTKGNIPSGNWDFGLYDKSKDGVLTRYGSQGIHKNAVCWVDFYLPEKQSRYRSLLEGPQLACSFAGSTLSQDSVSSSASVVVDNKPSGKSLVIKNLGVSFEPWDKNTGRAGAFIFLSTENKLFLEYGVEVQGSQGGTKILPTFEYRIAKDADVFAASDGVITKIAYQQQTQDYEILIQPEENSQWTLGHDHVSNISVSEGDNIKAGDILGKAGTLGGELGRTEIMIWGGPSSQNRPLTHCPFKLFAPELLSEYQQKVSRHMKDWEEFKGNSDLYAEGKHVFAGCLEETILD